MGMRQETAAPLVEDIMLNFARTTGLEPPASRPKRYLWTDAFAVCNYLELFRTTEDAKYRDLALALVDQVHHVLGRRRPDDAEQGWISGLSEEEGERHPTARGLRIGKPLKERGAGEPADLRREWDQDGQYYHYLTKWMHALSRASSITKNPQYIQQAAELARAAHSAFTYSPRFGSRKRMYWKMSTDLSRPLVPSMGQHDPLDGLVTYTEFRAMSRKLGTGAGLDGEIDDMVGILQGGSLRTDDALGVGGLLSDAWRIVQLTAAGELDRPELLENVLGAALFGVQAIAESDQLGFPAGYRLAFRELGLSIGLKGIERARACIAENPGKFSDEAAQGTEAFNAFIPLAREIDCFWTDEKNRRASTWKEHLEINTVMLATSLVPGEFLRAL